MRIKFMDRFWAAVSGAVILFLGICLFVFGSGIFPFTMDLSVLEKSLSLWARLGVVAAALALCALGIHGLSLLLYSRKEKGFIMQQTELGNMSISMQAMENMIKRCVDTHEDLKITRSSIRRVRDGVVVDVRVSMADGMNIPLAINSLQKQIKHYITSCSGVDVRAVRVMVETNAHQQPKHAELMSPEQVGLEAMASAQAAQESDAADQAEKEPMHQRIFKTEEKEQFVPPPPEALEADLPLPAEALAEVEEALKMEAETKETLSDETSAGVGADAEAQPEEAMGTEEETGKEERE